MKLELLQGAPSQTDKIIHLCLQPESLMGPRSFSFTSFMVDPHLGKVNLNHKAIVSKGLAQRPYTVAN